MSKRKFDETRTTPGLSAFAARRKFQDVGVVPDQTHDSISATVLGLEHEPLDVTDPLHEPQRDLTFVIPNAVGQRAASFSSCSSKDSLGDCACSPASLDVIEADNSGPVQQPPAGFSTTQFSTFRPTPENVIRNTRERLQVRLKSEESLVVLGQYDLYVRSGVVRLLGATLRPSGTPRRVYAPSTHALPPITAVPSGEGSSQTAEVELIACKSGIRRLKRICPYFARIWNEKSSEPVWPLGLPDAKSRSFIPICVASDDRSRRQLSLLKTHESWHSATSLIGARSHTGNVSVLICGAKSLGKSTFMRHVVNSMLTMAPSQGQHEGSWQPARGCALLDLDSGQPEFSPPGLISLVDIKEPIFGPPFTHPLNRRNDGSTVIRAHMVDGISAQTDPFHFRACVDDLLKIYQERLFPIPLFIDCPGWIEGVQLEVLVQLMEDLAPTDVVFLQANTPAHIVRTLEHAKGAASWHVLAPENSRHPSRSSAQLAVMQAVSYFHLTDPKLGCLRWNSTTITAHRPWLVRYYGQDNGIFGIMVHGDLVPKGHLITILDGSLVAIVVLEDEGLVAGSPLLASTGDVMESGHAVPHENGETTVILDEPGGRTVLSRTLSPENLPYLYDPHTNAPLNPASSHCVGLALVRGIDTERHNLYLLTPIPEATIRNLLRRRAKIVLVCGQLDTPSWAYTEDMTEEGHRSRRQKKDERALDGEGAEQLAEQLRMARRGNVPWATRVDKGHESASTVRDEA